MTLTIGTQVHYRDRANRKRIGPIDRIVPNAEPDGSTWYRVNDTYAYAEGLKVA